MHGNEKQTKLNLAKSKGRFKGCGGTRCSEKSKRGPERHGNGKHLERRGKEGDREPLVAIFQDSLYEAGVIYEIGLVMEIVRVGNKGNCNHQ